MGLRRHEPYLRERQARQSRGIRKGTHGSARCEGVGDPVTSVIRKFYISPKAYGDVFYWNEGAGDFNPNLPVADCGYMKVNADGTYELFLSRLHRSHIRGNLDGKLRNILRKGIARVLMSRRAQPESQASNGPRISTESKTPPFKTAGSRFILSRGISLKTNAPPSRFQPVQICKISGEAIKKAKKPYNIVEAGTESGLFASTITKRCGWMRIAWETRTPPVKFYNEPIQPQSKRREYL